MIDICTVGNNFAATWFVLSILGGMSTVLSSAIVFKMYFIDISYEKWKRKINPVYPTPEKVRDEIVLMIKGTVFSVVCPTISLWLSSRGMSHAYCTFSEENKFGWVHHFVQLLAIVVFSDFYEWFYHRLGHTIGCFWEVHRHHHLFYNPSPFSVISDEYTDQLLRAIPLVLFPMVTPINMELMFATYATLFYFYGVYLHWGHEFDWLSAHHPILNTSYQHYIHHAKAVKGKPYHTGFFFKIWDQLTGSVYKTCQCIKCQPPRSYESFRKVVKPDYSVLWTDWTLWISPKNINRMMNLYEKCKNRRVKI